MDITPTLNRRRREARPEHITVGGVVFERNDVCANRFGGSERALNRGDAKGAPFTYFNGVKYRPVGPYDEYVLKNVQQRNQPLQRRRARR